MSILQTLKTKISRKQAIPFVDFMHLALYAPNEGYYSSEITKFGRGGDFITAPELTSLFGATLAKQFQQVLGSLDSPILFEFGAGSGALCVTLLEHLEKNKSLPEKYCILEVSAHLRQRQRQWVEQKIPHLAHLIMWVEQWPETPFNGIIIANEVLDAMPVHRFMKTAQGIMESYIVLNAQQQLAEEFKPCQSEALLDYINNRLQLTHTPYVSEVNLFLDSWVLHLYRMLKEGMVFLIDYGFPRHEYYHSDRYNGTLMCHYQHRSHTDFLAIPGEQDITAHVDFTHVAEAAKQAGFHVAGFTNQASFLLANGLLSFIDCIENEVERAHAIQAIKQLTHPNEMGELFKVMALSKNLELSLNGFLLNDKRKSL